MKDDYHILEEACLEADGIIIGAPVYAVGIVGQFKNFVDRFGPSHDRAALIEENKKRKAEGKPELDPRYFKDRYTGFISVGGAETHISRIADVRSVQFLILHEMCRSRRCL